MARIQGVPLLRSDITTNQSSPKTSSQNAFGRGKGGKGLGLGLGKTKSAKRHRYVYHLPLQSTVLTPYPGRS